MPDSLQPGSDRSAPLRVAIAANRDDAERLARALDRVDNVGLVAHLRAPRSEALPGVRWCDDHRALLAHGEIDVLLICDAVRAGVELGAAAAECGVHVWRRPPLGRTFAEGVESIRHARRSETILRVASWWQFVKADLHPAVVFQPRFSELMVSAPTPPDGDWRQNREESGGGVLMLDCYDLLETLLAHMGLPETVYAATCVRHAQPLQPASRVSDDIAAAILRGDNGELSLVRGRRGDKTTAGRLEMLGDESSVVVDLAQHAVPLADGPVAFEMHRFFGAIRSETERRANEETLDRHLAVTAVLETLYLSARTGQSENPRSLYELERWPLWRTHGLQANA